MAAMDIEQLEALALSDDRAAALARLVPGSEDHDYWRAIDLQHRGALDAVDALLATWRDRHGSSLDCCSNAFTPITWVRTARISWPR